MLGIIDVFSTEGKGGRRSYRPIIIMRISMKTLYRYLLPVLGVLAACTSQDEPGEEKEGIAIAFDVSDTGRSRAGIERVGDMESFHVWGWSTDQYNSCTKVFNSQPVQRHGYQWLYAPTIYWMPNRDYQFLALASNKGGDSGLGASTAATFTTWEDAATIGLRLKAPYDEDLLYAVAEQATSEGVRNPPPVELRFRHLLARLRLEIRQAISPGKTVRLRSLTFRPRCDSCTFTPGVRYTEIVIPPLRRGEEEQVYTSSEVIMNASAPTTATAATYAMLADDPKGYDIGAYTPEYLYLAPGAAGTFVVSYELWQNRPAVLLRSYTDELCTMQALEGGKSYYTTILLPSATRVVNLEATLESWGEDNDTDREIISI